MSRDPECKNCGAPAEDKFGQPCGYCGVLIPKQQIWVPTYRLIPDLPRFKGSICLRGRVNFGSQMVITETVRESMVPHHCLVVTRGELVFSNLTFGNRLQWPANEPMSSGLFEQVGCLSLERGDCLNCGSVASITCENVGAIDSDFYFYIRGPSLESDFPPTYTDVREQSNLFDPMLPLFDPMLPRILGKL